MLSDYLYALTKAVSRFYDKKLGVRVIDASPESVRLLPRRGREGSASAGKPPAAPAVRRRPLNPPLAGGRGPG